MPVTQITARDDKIGHPRRLLDALERLPQGRSVTFMIHGFRYCPLSGRTDPHRQILAPRPSVQSWKAVSWPRHLRLDRPGADLGVGFGWPAQGPLPQVATRAFVAGRALAGAITLVRRHRPDLAINLMAHSLGARVALAALDGLEPRDLRQVILLSGAEYRGAAARAVAGSNLRLLNVTSQQNLVFDLMFRALVPAPHLGDRVLGAGLGPKGARMLATGGAQWLDLRLDRAGVRARLADLGYRIRPPQAPICHWSGYLGPGLFPLYRALLDREKDDVFARMRAGLAPLAPQHRTAGTPGLRGALRAVGLGMPQAG